MEPERITFPAEYPIKVIARAGEGLRQRLDDVFSAQFGSFGEDRVTSRPSGQNSFVAHTYRMTVHSEAQLTALHEALRALPEVIMVL